MANLLPNGTFEVNATGWTGNHGGETISRDTTEHRTGVASLKVITPGTNGTEGCTCSSSGRATVNPDGTYSIAVVVKGTAQVQVEADLFQSGGSYIDTAIGEGVTLSGDWEILTLDVTVPSNCAALAVNVTVAGVVQAATFYVDDVVVEAATSAAPAAMRDKMQRNPGTFTGTPVLIPTMLVRDPDPAVRFYGGSSFTVPHSSSLNLLNGAVGGIAIAFPLRLPAYPLAEALLFEKPGEYWASILPDGTLKFYAGSGSVESSAPIPLDEEVFVALVYNGGYTGSPVVGYTSQGAAQTYAYDYKAGSLVGANNLQVCRFQMLERGQLYQINADLQRYDNNPSFQDWAMAAYLDSGAAPGALAAQSAGQLLGSTALGTQPRVWQPFPIEGFIVDKDDYVWLGFAGGALHTSEEPVMMIGYASSGGTRKYKSATVSASSSGPASNALPSPYGAGGGADSVKLSVYADYTPLARSGDEGNLLIYLDGQEDARAAYTTGITAGSSALTGPELPCDLDEFLLWSRTLTAVEIAQLFAAR